MTPVLLELDEQDVPVREHAEITFIGTATVLFRLPSFTFLTDPNFLHAGEHAYLGGGLWSKRVTEPFMSISALPSLDFVLLSHHHGDHFDARAARELAKDLPIITEPRSADKLRKQGFTRALSLRKWESREIRRGPNSMRIASMPGKHSPKLLSPLIPSVMGFMLEIERADQRPFRIYVSGDTLMHDEIHQIPQRYPDIDLCIVHLGGTRVAGVLLTMDAKQGVQFLKVITPKAALPVHYDDYKVFRSPLSDFEELAKNELPQMDVHYLGRGGRYQLPL